MALLPTPGVRSLSISGVTGPTRESAGVTTYGGMTEDEYIAELKKRWPRRPPPSLTFFVKRTMQPDRELPLRREFESPRGLRIRSVTGAILAIMVTSLLVLLLLDPFGWLAGRREVHEAKKLVALSFGAILVPSLGGIWYLLVAPVRWGVIVGGGYCRWSSRDDYLVFRSEDPRQFWSLWRINLYFLVAACSIGTWCSIASVQHLRKVQAALNETAPGNGAIVAPVHGAPPRPAVPEQRR
jgi:hypothetical protein